VNSGANAHAKDRKKSALNKSNGADGVEDVAMSADAAVIAAVSALAQSPLRPGVLDDVTDVASVAQLRKQVRKKERKERQNDRSIPRTIPPDRGAPLLDRRGIGPFFDARAFPESHSSTPSRFCPRYPSHATSAR
jgi:hypothetical protein|tara:strand:- start:227 stop:631 length:405 start_codon:yes stop_codon:yes gene_type:complete